MDKVTGKLTIFFDNPFWVGVFESTDGKTLKVAKITFGSEPKDGEIYDFLLRIIIGSNSASPLQLEKYRKSVLIPNECNGIFIGNWQKKALEPKLSRL